MSEECNGITCSHLDRIEIKVDKILDNHVDLRINVAEITRDIAVNTLDLTEHKEGVIQNRKRIAKLERPVIMMDGIKKVAVWLMAVVGAVAALKGYKII